MRGFLSFNSRAPRGARPLLRLGISLFHSFNSRAPRGARHPRLILTGSPGVFQFTCPSRSTTFATLYVYQKMQVSIHVPLAEHDVDMITADEVREVSIHVPLAEHDEQPIALAAQRASFNSRAPRGARPLTFCL